MFGSHQETKINPEPSGDVCDVDGERALWAAVLQRTLRDAMWPRPVRNLHAAQGSVTLADQADARACLADVEWCEAMCERAGIDPGLLRRQTTQARRQS